MERFCLFVGYPRSGHSLVGSLLDAHPDVAIARAANALRLVAAGGLSRRELFDMLLDNSRGQAEDGRRQSGYSYAVEGQWQGRVRTLRVIGDKFGDKATKVIRRDPSVLELFERTIQVPLRLLHVTRNPYDVVARVALNSRRKAVPDPTVRAIAQVARLAETNSALIAAGTHPVLTVRHEDLIAEPRRELRRLCEFLEVEAAEPYLDACAAIVFPSPHRTRELIEWSDEERAAVDELIDRHGFLQDYRWSDAG